MSVTNEPCAVKNPLSSLLSGHNCSFVILSGACRRAKRFGMRSRKIPASSCAEAIASANPNPLVIPPPLLFVIPTTFVIPTKEEPVHYPCHSDEGGTCCSLLIFPEPPYCNSTFIPRFCARNP